MKKNIALRILSVVLVFAMLVCAIPMTAITAFAAESDGTESTVEPEKVLTPAEAVEKEMAERSTITKDRSQIKDGSEAAVYNNGKLHAEGSFSEMWKVALELAEYVKTDKDHSNTGKSGTVEFVLNKDLVYDKAILGKSDMTVSNQKITIDLNGHILSRSTSGSVISVDKGAVLTIMDSAPTRKNAGNIEKYGVWKAKSNGSTVIPGGVITGGDSSLGGALYIVGKSTVYMTGGTIAGNKAIMGSAVCMTDNSTLDMSRGNSQICYNYCANWMMDGGTVFMDGHCSMIGGYIHHNLVDDYGGGIRVRGNANTIKDVVIYANKAEEYGGGLYIERWNTGETTTISGCKIIENYAGEDGGGVYVYNPYLIDMSDTWVENNVAGDEGGGICLSDWTGTDLKISGKMIVRNNYEQNEVKSNLYLEGDDDLIVGTLSLGSEIWIKTEIPAAKYNGVDKTLLEEQTGTSHLFFFADEEGYCVKYQDDPAKANYRRMYLAVGTRAEDATKVLTDYATKQQETPYKVASGEYQNENFPLYKGYFEYILMSTTDFYSVSPFYYSDGYFFEDPTVYNTHLATMSINMAVAAFGRYSDDVEGNAYANHFANVKQLFSDIGCADVNFFANEDYQIKPAYYGEDGRLSTIAVAISQKEIKVNDDSYTLVPVAIRGGSYESEWASNVTIGSKGEAAGFADAANQVYGHIQNYIADYGLTEKVASGKVKFWVVGYSRAGATANLTSKRLVDSYAEGGNQVYGYTFEAPMGGAESAIEYQPYTGNGTYPTIHNTINELDFVTLVAPSQMGFFRYGVDHLVGSTTGEAGIRYKTDSDYYKQRMKMIAQLNAINPYYKFDDSWEVADINIILSNLPLFGTDLIDKGEQSWDNPNKECVNMYQFLRWFFQRIQGDGLDLPTKEIEDPDNPKNKITVSDFSYSREYFSTLKPLASIEGNEKDDNYGYSELTVQEAAAQLMYLVMESLTDEQMSAMIDAVITNAVILKDSMDTLELLGKKSDYIDNWDTHTELKKAQLINWLIPKILKADGGTDLATVLSEDQMKILTDALPVVIWFALNYASMDFNEDADDGMWGIGTFINNASNIISNHYQEVSVAWVRSYDDYYVNDLQSYKLDTAQITNNAPTGTFASASNTITLTAQAGSTIFYSVDGGESWSLYTKPVSLEESPEQILTFSVYRGVKSDVAEVSLNGWAGSILGNGNVWFLIIGSAFIVGFCVVGIEMSRKKKKETEEN